MPVIKFLETRVLDDSRKGTPDEVKFEAGRLYDLPLPSVTRWKKRGVAVDATPDEISALKRASKTSTRGTPGPSAPARPPALATPVVAAPPAVPVPPAALTPAPPVAPDPVPAPALASDVVIPGDWTELPWPKMKGLATRFSATPVHNRGDAIKIIEAELSRRRS